MPFDQRRFNALVSEFNRIHGFSSLEQGLVLSEETGELNEAILKSRDGKLFKDNSDPGIREEIGDVIYTAATIAQLYDIDPLEAAMDTACENHERGE